MVFLLGFAKKEILFPLSFAAFFRRKLGKEPYAPALQQKMLSLRSGRKKPGTFRRKGGAACRWHVSSAVLRCRVGRSYRSPPGTKTRSGAETASRSGGSSRRSPNRVRRSFASGLEKDLCLPLEGRGETDSCGICWMRWKAPRLHRGGEFLRKTGIVLHGYTVFSFFCMLLFFYGQAYSAIQKRSVCQD